VPSEFNLVLVEIDETPPIPAAVSWTFVLPARHARNAGGRHQPRCGGDTKCRSAKEGPSGGWETDPPAQICDQEPSSTRATVDFGEALRRSSPPRCRRSTLEAIARQPNDQTGLGAAALVTLPSKATRSEFVAPHDGVEQRRRKDQNGARVRTSRTLRLCRPKLCRVARAR
jgi:hypothetical protein